MSGTFHPSEDAGDLQDLEHSKRSVRSDIEVTFTGNTVLKGGNRLETLAIQLVQVLGDPPRVITQPSVVERLSRDFYWYSPILRPLLDDKRADVAVQPVSAEEVRAVLRLCYALEVPVTVRGAGTGNYGQAVPLQGGVVLDLARMDQIEAITSDGVAICQPGVRLGTLESTARDSGWELRCYPSTIVKATVGGFLGGGSGGVGSVAHGGLRDFNSHELDAHGSWDLSRTDADA